MRKGHVSKDSKEGGREPFRDLRKASQDREQQVIAKSLGQEAGWLEQSKPEETRKREGQRRGRGQSLCVLEAVFSM